MCSWMVLVVVVVDVDEPILCGNPISTPTLMAIQVIQEDNFVDVKEAVRLNSTKLWLL